MRIVTTMPGKFGDILWALPTARAIAEAYGEKVDFVTSEKYDTILPLVKLQPYINDAWADPRWLVQEEGAAPMSPLAPPEAGRFFHNLSFHLAYPTWPPMPLADYIHSLAHQQKGGDRMAPLDLTRPWITPPKDVVSAWPGFETDVAVGFSDEWIELKAGLVANLTNCAFIDKVPSFALIHGAGSRWEEWENSFAAEEIIFHELDWLDTAAAVARSKVFLGCLSSMWVLANALGKPCVIVEPAEARWNPIFWREHPLNTLVKGNDGRPTFDSRHVRDALAKALKDVDASS